MRTWVVGIFIGVCILTSGCKDGNGPTIPGKQPASNSPGVKIQPEKRSLLKSWDFTYDCLTNQQLGKAEIARCRDQLSQADTDKEVNKP